MKIYAKILTYIVTPMFLLTGYVTASGMIPCNKSERYRHLCYGTQFYPNGGKYTGEWVNLKQNGQGVYTFANGNIYIGEFLDDKFHGQGTFIFNKNAKKPGEIYVGGFRNNKYHGHGHYTFADGGEYVGEFHYGRQSGKGNTSRPIISLMFSRYARGFFFRPNWSGLSP